ncbi:MAG: hypothetical protein AAF497_05685 [Planctomycetota bacterium]
MLRKFNLFAPILLACFASAAFADELIVSFVAELQPGNFTGPAEINPFDPSTQIGGGVAANPDLIKMDAQFIVKDFDPNFSGTYSFMKGGGSDAGVEFFAHSPLLERIEALTTRIGSNSPQGYSANTKILLPRTDNSTTTDDNGITTTGFFGNGQLVVENGVPVSLSYDLGPESLSSFDFLFNPSSLEELSVIGSSFSLENSYDLDTPGAADDAPYGFNTTLMGAPGSTVLDSTRGIIQAELDAPFAGGGTGNLLTTRESSGGVPLPFDPLDGTGTLYHYSLSGAEMFVTAVVPEPASGVLAMLSFLGLFATLRRNRK